MAITELPASRMFPTEPTATPARSTLVPEPIPAALAKRAVDRVGRREQVAVEQDDAADDERHDQESDAPDLAGVAVAEGLHCPLSEVVEDDPPTAPRMSGMLEVPWGAWLSIGRLGAVPSGEVPLGLPPRPDPAGGLVGS